MRQIKKYISVIMMAVAYSIVLQSIIACTPEDDFVPNTVNVNIYDRLVSADRAQYDSLIIALDRSELDVLLKSEGNFTLFAKRNQAFREANISPSVMDPTELRNFMEYYVVNEAVSMDALNEFTTIETLSGEPVYVSLERWFRTLNGRGIQNRDVYASNGLIQVMNNFIPRPDKNLLEAATELGHTIFVEAVDAADLNDFFTDENNPITVFIPNNEAFESLLSDAGYATLSDIPMSQLRNILYYHSLSGRRYYRDLMKPFTPNFDEVWSPGADVNTTILPSYFTSTFVQGSDLELINRGAVRVKGRGNTNEINRITGSGVNEGFTATNGTIHVIGEVLLFE